MSWRILFTVCVFCLLIFTFFQYLISANHSGLRNSARSGLCDQDQADTKADPSVVSLILRSARYPRFLQRIITRDLHCWSGIPIGYSEYLVLWWVVISVCTFSAGGLVVIGFGSQAWVLMFFLVASGSLGPYLIVKYQIQKRKRDLERSLPDYLDLLSLTIEAGFGLVPALRRINQGFRGALGEIVQGAMIQIDLGFSKTEAFKGLVSRTPSDDLRQFIDALLLSESLGISLSRTIRIQAGLSRARMRQRAEIKARTTPIRIIPALVFFFLPGLLLIYLAPPVINFLMLK